MRRSKESPRQVPINSLEDPESTFSQEVKKATPGLPQDLSSRGVRPAMERRHMLQAAGLTAAAAVAALASSENPAAHAAPNIEGSFAPGPTGGDDSGLLQDAMVNGRILGPGTYKLYKPLSLYNGVLLGIPTKTCIEVHCPQAFVDAQAYNGFYVDGINFECDPAVVKNVFVNTYTGGDVQGHHQIRNCFFHAYSGAAISWAQDDMPYLKMDNCRFWGANTLESMAVAMATAGDQSLISNCDFIEYQHALFLGSAANRVRVRDCEFLHNSSPLTDPATGRPLPRVDVWIEPVASLANSGCGTVIEDNKFGNENRAATDLNILFADRGSPFVRGSSQAGNWRPKYSASSGYLSLQTIQRNDFSGAASTPSSPITSYTPNLVGCNYGPNVHSGTRAATEVNFLGGFPQGPTGTRIDTGFSWDSTPLKPTNAPLGNFKIIS